ncbi:NACHT, LRR and PYD domains-containing protein 9A-like isoform X2 [Apodemus sylvaticus]|uniref:NACHT, LRR and PYD domains-containing protein 9A-like isoform X2 n=1 Tax=Apodemus sylvaticus TaxID=10129 RepID=UPI002244A4DF|nr:NACHT, LRR and PYD domains-containing protein 9A-like isoform X2 [Apodemus sylvaticus]
MMETSCFGLLQYLQKLSDKEFQRFKELLRKEPKKFKLKPISWTKIKNTSKEDLVMQLNKHYPEKVWNIVLSLFVQVNREDLSTMIQKERIDKYTKYKKYMKNTFQHIWTLETNTHITDRSYHKTIELQYRALQGIFDRKSKPITAVVSGSRGEGKTIFLRKVVLDWAAGNLLQNRFRYVFFFSVFTLNTTTEFSLAELISSNLPESSETLDDILSDPKRILFILEGFDYLKFDLELRTNLCNDCTKKLPTEIVLSSLLQKIMLQECSLLLELGDSSLSKIIPLLQYPREIMITGFPEQTIEFYCVSHFNIQRGREIFENLKRINTLFTLCSNPLMCWMICSSLKWQDESREVEKYYGGTVGLLYTLFMVSAFKSTFARTQSKHNSDQLKTLCTLAVEGMWKQVYVFDSEDLRRNGISETDKAVWLRMNFFQNQGHNIVFYHHTLQWYFAILFYFLKQGKETHHPIIGSLPQLLGEIYSHKQNQWFQTQVLLFGMITEQVASLLEPCFGFVSTEAVRQEIIRYIKSLSQQECNEKLLRTRNLFFCLLSNQEESFVTQVMDLFEEITVDICNVDDLSATQYCLQQASKLKHLHLHIQKRVFSEIHDSECGDLENFNVDKEIVATHWPMICSYLHKLYVLDLDSCHFSRKAIQDLCNSMSPSPTVPLTHFKLQSLWCSFMTNFGDGSLFHTLLQLPHLKYLNLYGTNLSNHVVEMLCSALRCSTCKVEELLLGKCDISSEACGIIATSLINSKVKHLSLVENPLKNKGVMSLCEVLKDPNCVLESLMLSYCCLTFIACGSLYEALLSNKHLSLLDLESNFLEDTGVNLLCEALKDPNCTLEELWLSGCYLTPESCEEIYTVFTCNKNLKTLKLGNNSIQDAGVKQLCEALCHPNCKLQCLGLDMCELTSDCCEDLALALTTCNTLKSLNLDWNLLEHSGLEVLCDALNHKDCNLKMLGLDKSLFPEKSQTLLQAVEKENKNLNVVHFPWIEEECQKRGVRLVWNSTN